MADTSTLMTRLHLAFQSWIVEKIEGIKNETLKRCASSLLVHLYTNPFKGGFFILTTALCIGPISFCLAFIFLTNACLLSGAVVIELIIIVTALMMLLFVLFFASLFSISVVGGIGVISALFFNTRRNVGPNRIKAKRDTVSDRAAGVPGPKRKEMVDLGSIVYCARKQEESSVKKSTRRGASVDHVGIFQGTRQETAIEDQRIISGDRRDVDEVYITQCTDADHSDTPTKTNKSTKIRSDTFELIG